MRKTYIHAPKINLPVVNARSVLIVPENRIRIGLIINNYGTSTIYLYDEQKIVRADNGFSIFPGFGLAMMTDGTCPQSALYAGQAAAGGILNIIEITKENIGKI